MIKNYIAASSQLYIKLCIKKPDRFLKPVRFKFAVSTGSSFLINGFLFLISSKIPLSFLLILQQMKIHTKILLLIMLFSFTQTYSQRIARHVTDEGSVYPIITITSLISMYNMAIADWERNMKLITKVRDDYGEDGVTYTIQNKAGSGDGWCFVTKKQEAIEIAYNFGSNRKSLFTDLVPDLKKYYVKDVDSHQVYFYKYLLDPAYVFLVTTSGETEYVRMYLNPEQ